jgi:putative tricarboxylic transport membrane protein
VNNSMADVCYMLLLGIVACVFTKLGYPLVPTILALVLGDLAAAALGQCPVKSQGLPRIFLPSRISAAITLVAVVLFSLPVGGLLVGRLRALPGPPVPAERQ